jgi:di/tricarboxylate transporter
VGLDSWLTLATLAAVVIGMARELVPPTMAVLGGSIFLMLTGVISTEDAFAGFSNAAPLTVAALYILAAAVSRTGLLRQPLSTALRNAETDRGVLTRLLPGVAAASSFLNNTPIVAMLVPEMSSWAHRKGRAPSRFLMPMSFAAILGGTITLLGTSTNLLVSGLLSERTGEPLGFFEITPVGLPLAVVGVAAVVLLTDRLLPEHRSSPREDLSEEFREFVFEMRVVPDGALDGIEVEEGGLRHLAGVFLVEIVRGSHVISPVRPTTSLEGGDLLRFVGKASEVVDLLEMPGLESAHAAQMGGFDLTRSNFYEAVIGPSSPLAGTTLKEAQFRSRYQGAVVAIHRGGQRIDAKFGEVRLRSADTLVVLAESGFRERYRDRQDFLLISRLGEPVVSESRPRLITLVVAAGFLVIAAGGIMPILHAALLADLAIVALRVLTPSQARDAINLDVVLLIAGSFGLAAAMDQSGLAERLASGLVGGLEPFGVTGVLIGIVLATLLLTESVSNAAAAVVVFPIAFAAALELGVDPRGFAVAVAVAASASFLTPVGYQTNMMVYGPGGYRYSDYARLGSPLTLLTLALTVGIVQAIWI